MDMEYTKTADEEDLEIKGRRQLKSSQDGRPDY